MSTLPPPSSDAAQHPRLLAILHYVAGGLTALFACFPLLHVALGLAMVFAPRSFANKPGDEPPPFVGWALAGMVMGLFLARITLAVCVILTDRFLARRKTLLVCLCPGLSAMRRLSLRRGPRPLYDRFPVARECEGAVSRRSHAAG